MTYAEQQVSSSSTLVTCLDVSKNLWSFYKFVGSIYSNSCLFSNWQRCKFKGMRLLCVPLLHTYFIIILTLEFCPHSEKINKQSITDPNPFSPSHQQVVSGNTFWLMNVIECNYRNSINNVLAKYLFLEKPLASPLVVCTLKKQIIHNS